MTPEQKPVPPPTLATISTAAVSASSATPEVIASEVLPGSGSVGGPPQLTDASARTRHEARGERVIVDQPGTTSRYGNGSISDIRSRMTAGEGKPDLENARASAFGDV